MLHFQKTNECFITCEHVHHRKKNTPSSSNIGALATDNHFRIVQNTYMCFVTHSFSLIFKVCNLSFKYIFVTTSYDSSNLINYVHASCDVL
jgi:hypothetical protein